MSAQAIKIQEKIKLGNKAFTENDYNSALEHYLDAALHVVTLVGYIPVRQKVRALLATDIDEDGNDEILYGTEGNLIFARRANGNEIWKFSTRDWVTGIEYVDINSDGVDEIIVASDKIYILNKNGELLGEHDIPARVSSLKVYKKENSEGFIVVGDKNGYVTCYDFDFNLLGSFQTEGKGNVIDIAIGDFDGDGVVEIAAASEDRHVYIINKQGLEIDKMRVNHWIINMDALELNNNKSRLYIGEFQGETYIYKPKSQSGQSISLSSILDLKVAHLFDNKSEPQFIVGSSDRQLAFFDYNGDLLWAFESGLGQRVICIKTHENGKLNLYVGTESGEIFSYSIQMVSDLVKKIKEAYFKLDVPDLMDIRLDAGKLKVLRNFIEYNPIKTEASIKNAIEYKNTGSTGKTIVSAMEVWWNDCEYLWEYETKGRVYDITISVIQQDNKLTILSGSADGSLYCVDHEKNEKWSFHSVFGREGEIRGVFANRDSATEIIVASADKSLYMLDCNGNPLWNFQHIDSMLFAYMGRSKEDKQLIFVGTEDHKVLAFDNTGLLLWEKILGERVRAISFCDNYDGIPCVIAGSDDNYVYIFDCEGNDIFKFETPHYVLALHAQDIDADGSIEILTGNENGHLHVYDIRGNLLWRFETGSWVAALDVLVNKDTRETEIIIGSQDNHVYSLNKNGALLWQYETAARVRTLCADSDTNKIAFGSYNKKIYLLAKKNRSEVVSFISSLHSELLKNIGNEGVRRAYSKSDYRHERAFSLLFETDIEVIRNAISDHAEIVLAAIGCNLSENFIVNNSNIDFLIEVLKKSSRKTSAIILGNICSLLKEGKIKRSTTFRIICALVQSSMDTSLRIDAFRHWATIAGDFCEVIEMAVRLLPETGRIIDEFMLDELNHACLIAMKLPVPVDNLTVSHNIDCIATQIKSKYPKTVNLIKKIIE